MNDVFFTINVDTHTHGFYQYCFKIEWFLYFLFAYIFRKVRININLYVLLSKSMHGNYIYKCAIVHKPMKNSFEKKFVVKVSASQVA